MLSVKRFVINPRYSRKETLMLLPLYDLATRKWEGELPFPNTLAEAMFPDVAYALIHAGAEDVDAGTLAEGAAQAGYRLDFAGGGKKDGTFVMTDTPVAPTFWEILQEAAAFGSILLPQAGARPLSDRLRLAAYVDGKMLGVVSSETPVPQQNTYRLRLTRSPRGKGQVVYALPAA
jgi:hypothetical protein